jgi:hypothetical protein
MRIRRNKEAKKKKSTKKYALGNKQKQYLSMNYCLLYTFVMAVM